MEKRSKLKTVFIALICFLTIAVVQSLPVFFPKPLGSKTIEDKNIILYYQPGNEIGAKEVFALLKEKSVKILMLHYMSLYIL